MPFGLPNTAVNFQHRLRSVLAAQVARHHAVLAEMPTVLRKPPGPPEPPGTQVAREEQLLQRASSATSISLQQWCQVTLSGSFSRGCPSGYVYPKDAWACPCDMYPFASLTYLVGGTPRAASSPGRVGPSLWHVSFLHLSELALSSSHKMIYAIACLPVTIRGLLRC